MNSSATDNSTSQAAPLRVATIDVVQVACGSANGQFDCRLEMRCQHGAETVCGRATSREAAVADALSSLCRRPFEITEVKQAHKFGQTLVAVAAREQVVDGAQTKPRIGVGRCSAMDADLALVMAALRAISHAGMLKKAYRANNQRVLRGWSRELLAELMEAWQLESVDKFSRLEAQGIILEHLNRVASAAVITATNYPRPDSVLKLFDTSAWLYDSQGSPRDAYTDTPLWLAWYPGVQNDHLTVDEVVQSMPAAPDTAIPWIVKLFENPSSWLRFRGAVDLEDHDILHVLLGRGLQDQDEAFVIGFAMGTAKRINWLEYRVFKFVLARLYPEPYRIPRFLQPAFDLGVRCGQETGARNLYQRQLKELRSLKLGAARREAEIDMDVVRRYYQLEQEQIPFTIASLRLP